MPKRKYMLKNVLNGTQIDNNDNSLRPFEKNLLNLSSVGIKWNTSLIRSMRGVGADETAYNNVNGMMDVGYEPDLFKMHSSVAGQNDYVALFDQNYVMRRDFLRKFALQDEIEYVIDTITNEAIVLDDMNFFAYPDINSLKAKLKKNESKEIINDLNTAFRRVYHAWRFDKGSDAWQWVKKFLIDGFLCFEILYKTDQSTKQAIDIIGFNEIDPVTIEPAIKYDKNGNEYKVWIQYKDDRQKERVLLDANVIYISWAKNNFISRLSYVERLIRPFNMLRTIENSHLIWNIQNAQRRVNVTVPMGAGAEQRGRNRMSEIMAYFKEDVNIDADSGELMVNGQPKFQFYKTYFTPSKNGEKVEVSEIEMHGHDMTTDAMKYYWQKFIIATGIPKDRVQMMLDGGTSANYVMDSSNVTKEEYKFSLFIRRLRGMIQEMLLKPTWIQFCFKYPNFATNDLFKSSFGVKFIEENLFENEKRKKILESGANVINTLSAIKTLDGSPAFSVKFLMDKFMMMSPDEWKLNQIYIEKEMQNMKKQGQGPEGGDMGGGNSFGDMGGGNGFGDMGGGNSFGDMGGGNSFGDMGGGAPEGLGADFGDSGGEVPEDSAPEAGGGEVV
jgi:hypothetical protein